MGALQPFLVEELGRDFFLKTKPGRKVYWFECPSSGAVHHSGRVSLRAKKMARELVLPHVLQGSRYGNREKQGFQYCPMCHKCFSATNFMSQHLKMHRAKGSVTASASPAMLSLMSKLGLTQWSGHHN